MTFSSFGDERLVISIEMIPFEPRTKLSKLSCKGADTALKFTEQLFDIEL